MTRATSGDTSVYLKLRITAGGVQRRGGDLLTSRKRSGPRTFHTRLKLSRVRFNHGPRVNVTLSPNLVPQFPQPILALPSVQIRNSMGMSVLSG